MKRIILSTIFGLMQVAAFCQEASRILKLSPPINVAQGVINFTIDNLANSYLLLPNNQVKKLNDKGDSLAVFNDVKRFGKIFSIDATNPLKVLIFYKDFSTIVVLDRLLNVINTIDLRKQNMLQVSAITSSYDNNIWIYDELESKIKKIDDNGNLLLESTDLRQVFDAPPLPVNMYDRDGQLYMYDPAKGLFVFDYYGGKRNNFQLPHLFDLQVIDKNTITARDNSHLILYKPSTLQLISFTAAENLNDFTKINFNGNTIYCLSKSGELRKFTVIN